MSDSIEKETTFTSGICTAIPTCVSMATYHVIDRIDGCAALIIDIPDAASLSKEREGV